MKCKKHRRTVFCLEKMIARSSQKDDVDAAESYRANYARRLRDHFGNEYAPQQIHDRASQGDDPSHAIVLTSVCMCAVVGHFISSHNKALEESVGTKVVCRGFSRAWYDKEVRDLEGTTAPLPPVAQGLRLAPLLQSEDCMPQANPGEETSSLGANPRLARAGL